MNKVAAKKTKIYNSSTEAFDRVDRICDLVDCWVDKEITQDELIERLMTIIDKRIIKVSDIEFIVSEWEGNMYLESRQQSSDGTKDNWVQVEDLCDLTVWEYNELVSELIQWYPDYPIEYLEGRFV